MSWKDIVASNERDNVSPNLERVIKALELLYGNRKQVIESNILGVKREEDLGRIGTINKKYINNLIEDMGYAEDETMVEEHLDAVDALHDIHDTLPF
tara:strand:- start:202 stop:492 length:291 start_codon:yes stop_codon:yes gene_type:complete